MPPSPDEVVTTTPGSHDAIILGTKASTPFDVPKTLTPKHQRQSFGSWSHGLPPPPEVTPALFQSMLQAPYSPKTVSASASTEAKSDTSVTTPRTSPRSFSSLTVCSNTGASMSASTTRAPSSSRASTMPLPMPAAPPVTTATLCRRSFIFLPQERTRSHPCK